MPTESQLRLRSHWKTTESPKYFSVLINFLLQKNTKAPQAAGRIHTDFEKGFIMAEVMKFEDFKAEGSEAAAKVRQKELENGTI